jgi:O-antigen/teichoic acid export membrane protein
MHCNDKVKSIHLPTHCPMRKKFLVNLFITLLANLLVKPIWILGIDRTFQNRLGLEAYGAYTSVFTFSLILGLLLDFGINNYHSSALARNPHHLQKQFVPLVFIKLGLAFGYVLLTMVLGWWYGFKGEYLWLLFVLCINQCLSYCSTFLRSTLTGLQLYKTDAVISSVDRFAMIIAGSSVLLFVLFPVTVSSFVYIQTIGYFIALIVSFFALYPHLRQIEFKLDLRAIKPALRVSFPFAVLALIMMLYTRTDVLLIKKMLPNGDTENGIYAQSIRLLDAVNMLAVLVSGLLLPMFSSMLKQRQPINDLVKSAMLVLWVPAIMGVVFCYHFANEIMLLLYHETNPYHASILMVCISSVLPMCVMYIFGTLLTARGKMRVLIQTAVVALGVNIMGNLWLIPRMGAEGAAWVALCTYSVVAIGNMWVALNRLPIKVSSGYLIRFPLFGFFCYGLLKMMLLADISVVATIGGYIVLGGVMVILLQLVDAHTLKKVQKRFR